MGQISMEKPWLPGSVLSGNQHVGIGPGPMAGMLLSDMGATVLRVERPATLELGVRRPARFNFLKRGRYSVAIDLKQTQGVELALSLIERSDGLIEGFRPGVMERLGLGPDVCFRRNHKLIYGRVTGWGQNGPLAQSVGHDLNYIALSGALAAIGRRGQPPTPPLNLLGDYGGAAYLCMGILAALISSLRNGVGQVVDAAMVDVATSLMTSVYAMNAAGMHSEVRGTNLLDSGSPYYDVYECADGKFISIAPIETRFRSTLFKLIGLEAGWVQRAENKAFWPQLRLELEACFRRETREYWCKLLEGTDACFAPVLSMTEAPFHPHQVARKSFLNIDGLLQPSPAPRFSRTESKVRFTQESSSPTSPDFAMQEWGFSDGEIKTMRESGVLCSPKL